MMSKIFSTVIAFTGIIALSGCKPKEATITGQVFIATAGGMSIRLGAVEVQLIEKQQAIDFIQKKQREFPAAKQALEKAQADYNASLDAISKELEPLEVQLKQLRAENKKLRDATEADSARLARASMSSSAYLSQSKTVGLQCGILWMRSVELFYEPGEALSYPNLYKDKVYPVGESPAVKRWREFIDASTNSWPNLRGEIKERRETRARTKAEKESIIAAATSHLASLTASDLLIANYSPVVIAKANTDADGNFSITCPHNKQFAIFARAERTTLSEPEKYFWLVNATVDKMGGRVLLNNNNFVQIDPDGYFKPKPTVSDGN